MPPAQPLTSKGKLFLYLTFQLRFGLTLIFNCNQWIYCIFVLYKQQVIHGNELLNKHILLSLFNPFDQINTIYLLNLCYNDNNNEEKESKKINLNLNKNVKNEQNKVKKRKQEQSANLQKVMIELLKIITQRKKYVTIYRFLWGTMMHPGLEAGGCCCSTNEGRQQRPKTESLVSIYSIIMYLHPLSANDAVTLSLNIDR